MPPFLSAGFALLMVLLISTVPVQAQTQPMPPYHGHVDSPPLGEEDSAPDRQAALLHFATQYTGVMIVGLMTGGLLMNQLVGGVTATLAGTLVGSLLGCWLFLNRASDHYVIHQTP